MSNSEKADKNSALISFNGMYTCSPLMMEIFEWLKKAASANVPVYIWGETGTGKELTARALHEESTRKGTPFVSCLLYTSPSPRDQRGSRMPSSA